MMHFSPGQVAILPKAWITWMSQKIRIKPLGSVGDFTPIYPIYRWNNPWKLIIWENSWDILSNGMLFGDGKFCDPKNHHHV